MGVSIYTFYTLSQRIMNLTIRQLVHTGPFIVRNHQIGRISYTGLTVPIFYFVGSAILNFNKTLSLIRTLHIVHFINTPQTFIFLYIIIFHTILYSRHTHLFIYRRTPALYTLQANSDWTSLYLLYSMMQTICYRSNTVPPILGKLSSSIAIGGTGPAFPILLIRGTMQYRHYTGCIIMG